MSKYCVVIPEVHLAYLMVDANSEEEAITKVADGDGQEFNLEYSHTFGNDEYEWKVNKMD